MRQIWLAALLGIASAASAQTAAAPAFDVASIRLSGTTAGSYLHFLPGGRLSADSWIKQIIQIAYGVKNYQVTGGPGWLSTDWYSIEAKAEKVDATKEDMTAMLRTLLTDRFKLQLHQQTKAFDVYNLVAAKDGPRLKALVPGQNAHCTRDNTFMCGMTNPTQLAQYLESFAGRPIIDKTGITGRYEILLDFDTYAASGRTPPEGYDKPSLEHALEDQLGLRLVPAKVPMPVYAVESISRPSDN